jgi:formate dehydrogenase iron-sulfur subunit
MKMNSMAILTDVTKCIGCEKCVDACQQVNELPQEQPWRWVKNIDDLSSARWTTIKRVSAEKGERFVRKQCLHCVDPSCVSVCIVGALKKTDEGPVIYDKDLCIGCRYCMIACPWEIPRYSWEDSVPYVQKCHMCHERVLKEGKIPACVEACPEKATIFGEREELLAEARRRLAAEPDKYVQRIWGAKEVGGTSVLYISDVDIKLTGLDEPVVDEESIPHRTTKILHQMPTVFGGMAVLMAGLYWVIKRRQKVMALSAGENSIEEQKPHQEKGGTPASEDKTHEQVEE